MNDDECLCRVRYRRNHLFIHSLLCFSISASVLPALIAENFAPEKILKKERGQSWEKLCMNT